eukprot:1884929-Pyramimonas_sp.AAC.1
MPTGLDVDVNHAAHQGGLAVERRPFPPHGHGANRGLHDGVAANAQVTDLLQPDEAIRDRRQAEVVADSARNRQVVEGALSIALEHVKIARRFLGRPGRRRRQHRGRRRLEIGVRNPRVEHQAELAPRLLDEENPDIIGRRRGRHHAPLDQMVTQHHV